MFAMGPAFFGHAAASYATLTLTGMFAAATVGVAYSSSIPISGGLEPYSLTGGTGVASGSLDSGFSLSITGTTGARFLTLSCASPTTADTMTFTASADSSDGQTATSAQSVVVAPATSADAVSIYNKLVTWWQLDEASGSLIDSHVYAFNATVSANVGNITYGSATVRSAGSRSVLFNGDSHSNCSTSLDAYILGAMDHALFCWYSPTTSTSSNERAILTSYDTTSAGSSSKNDQIGMYITAAGKPESVWRYGSSSTPQLVLSTRSLTGGANYFLGYNKITSTKKVEWWINNVSETPIAYANEPTGTSLPPCLGALKGQSIYQAAGRLQNLTTFNAALTSAEVAWLYNAGAGRSYAELKAASGH